MLDERDRRIREGVSRVPLFRDLCRSSSLGSPVRLNIPISAISRRMRIA